MTQALSEWIRSIAAASLISAMALVITPPGRVQRVTRVVCGVLMIIAIISPLTKIDGESITLDIAQYRQTSREIAAVAEEERANMSRTIIQAELSEYILDKAARQGVELEAAVVAASWSDEGFWYPHSVELSGVVTQQEKELVSAMLEAELGINADGQCWRENENELS